MMQVKAWELVYNDPYANSHKFYRLYVLPQSYMVQWGRIGTTGQFNVKLSNSPEWDARDQSYAKENKGYETTGPPLEFDVDESWVTPNTRTQQLALVEYFTAAKYRQENGVSVGTANIDQLQAKQQQARLAKQKQDADKKAKEQQEEDKLKATLLRITAKAEPDSAELSEPSDNNSMEGKLAAAMARAKENR